MLSIAQQAKLSSKPTVSLLQLSAAYPTIACFRRSAFVYEDSYTKADRREGEEMTKRPQVGRASEVSRPTEFKNNKAGWRCGQTFIPKKSKCYTDPVSGQKLKQPIDYNLYRQKRAESVKRQAAGKSLSDQEKIYAASVESDRAKLIQRKESAKLKEAAKSVGASQVLPGGIAEVDPQLVKVDPKRFQYKLSGANTKSGTVGSLSGVKKWDANLAGIIQVWQDPKDKNVYVVNGHNRLELEKKLGVPKRPARFIKAESAKEARAVGALTNIAEGRGNARDAAKFLRDSGISKDDLDKKGVPLKEKIATDGLALSNLSDGLFNQVIQSELPEARAIVIGDKLKDYAQQEALVKLIGKEEKRGRKITNDVVSELADMTSTAPKKQEDSSGSLLSLLGFDPDERSLAIEKAEISASVKRQLSKDKKLFGTVGKSKAALDLERAGNQINIEESASISRNANTALTLFDKTKNQTGEVDQILNKSAERLANGEKREKVAREAREEIERHLQERFKYGRKRSGNSPGNSSFKRRAAKVMNFNNELYYYQTRNGKKIRVRKNKRKIDSVARHDLITGARYGGAALGFVAGTGAGSLLVKAAGRNGGLRNTAMTAGAVTGTAIAAILANHLLDKYENG